MIHILSIPDAKLLKNSGNYKQVAVKKNTRAVSLLFFSIAGLVLMMFLLAGFGAAHHEKAYSNPVGLVLTQLSKIFTAKPISQINAQPHKPIPANQSSPDISLVLIVVVMSNLVSFLLFHLVGLMTSKSGSSKK